MPTKFSRICTGIMEAAWLAAVILVPVFFNIYSSRVFEPDKIALLRSLALAILAAWGVRWFEEGRSQIPGPGRLRTWMRKPLVLPVIALASAYLISTLLSITPVVSLFGSYQRLQGAYTTFSYLVIFAAIAANLRRREQFERLLSAVILASLPVSAYGIFQRYGLDPVPWGGNVTTRVAANLGNPIFVAAYLIMVFPLTAVRLLKSWRDSLTQRAGLGENLTRTSAYLFIAALQVTALLFSGSRGPLLGWLASSFFLFLVLSTLWRRRWVTASLVGLAAAILVFLVLFNLPGGPLQELRSMPGIGRLGQLLDAESRTGRVRTLIWQGAAEMVAPHPPLEYPDGQTDTLNSLRLLIGYGPESMYVAYNRFYPPALTQVEKRNATPDRAHNETWDVLITQGILGLGVYVVLFSAIFLYGLRLLGWVQGQRQRNLFWALYLGMGAASTAVFVIWRGPAYLGVSLPAGLVAGLMIYLILVALSGAVRRPGAAQEQLNQENRWQTLVAAGLLAAILAHFVEINFGIAIAATRTLFWVYAGLLLVVGGWMEKPNEAASVGTDLDPAPASPQNRESTRNRRTAVKKKKGPAGRVEEPAQPGWAIPWGEILARAVLVTLILSSLGYAFLLQASGGASAAAILQNSLVRMFPGNGQPSTGILVLFLAVLVISSLVLSSEGSLGQPARSWLKSLAAILAISTLLSLAYLLLHAAALAAVGRIQVESVEVALEKALGFQGLFTAYFLFILILVGLLGIALSLGQLRGMHFASGRGRFLAPLALAAFLWIVAATNLRPIQADIIFKQGEVHDNTGAYPAAARLYEQAVRLAPREDLYLLHLGRAYLEWAKTESGPASQSDLLVEAEERLRQAQATSPLNPDHTANLARLYSTWGTISNDPEKRAQYAGIASDYYEQATRLSPNNANLWAEWASIYLALSPQLPEARTRLERALELDPLYDWTYGLLGEYYISISENAQDPEEKQVALEKAAENYAEALQLSEDADPRVRFSYAVALGGSYVRLDQPELAVQAYLLALEINPQADERWQIEEALAHLFLEMGAKETALEHASQALALAPEEQSVQLEAWIEQIQALP